MLRLAIITAFSLAMGHFTWEVYHSGNARHYVVGGEVPLLSAPDQASHLYLRRTFHASQRPRFGWLQVLGRSRVTIYVNGRLVADREQDGFPVAIVLDICPFLQRGKNVIALATEAVSLGQPGVGLSSVDPRPGLAVEGMYECGGAVHRIGRESAWKCHDLFERSASWWFEEEFDDRHWCEPEVQLTDLRARVDVPPRAVTEPGAGVWITPATSIEADQAVFCRQFDVSGYPSAAWLRVTTTNAYRLAINGTVVDVQDEPLGMETAATAVQRVYDVTPHVRSGKNAVAIAAISQSGPPRVLVDGEVLCDSRKAVRLDSDRRWRSRPGVPARWNSASIEEDVRWEPCTPETGDVGVPPWAPKRETGQITLSATSAGRRVLHQAGLVMLIGIATAVGCSIASRLIVARTDSLHSKRFVYTALLVPTLFLSVLVLATYDPRVPRQAVYRECWILVSALSVPLQWGLLAWIWPRNLICERGLANRETWSGKGLVLTGLLITLAGFWLRCSEIDVKPLQHDEASAYRSTQGFFERGFPSREIHPDMPPKLVETSELVYFCTVLATLVFDQDVYIVRVPAVLWGTLAIYLIFSVGWRMFSPAVGLTAAAIYAMAPICVQMACFGRYFSQLQFFALLTVYCFWHAIREQGPVNRKALWCTAASFVAMYFTWQGSALLAPGFVVAGLIQCRGRLSVIVTDRKVWSAVAAVLAVIVLHMSCRSLHLSQFLAYGVGISGLSLTRMWQFPDFDLTYCFWQSSWNRDAVFPMLGLMGATFLAIRHPYKRAIRLILGVFATTCVVVALVLPVYTWRYSLHLSPLVILLAAASVVASARSVVPKAGEAVPLSWTVYRHAVGTCLVLVVIATGSGTTLQLTELSRFHIPTYALPDLKFADLTAAMHFLRARLEPGDVILASNPHVVDHYMESRACDYWLQSRFYTQAMLDDNGSTPRHRIAGTLMLSSRQELEELFSRHDRIWYIMIPSRHASQNTADVTAFIRQHMQVAYQDYRALVLFRGSEHFPAATRAMDEQALLDAGAEPLPE